MILVFFFTSRLRMFWLEFPYFPVFQKTGKPRNEKISQKSSWNKKKNPLSLNLQIFLSNFSKFFLEIFYWQNLKSKSYWITKLWIKNLLSFLFIFLFYREIYRSGFPVWETGKQAGNKQPGNPGISRPFPGTEKLYLCAQPDPLRRFSRFTGYDFFTY